MFHVERHVNPFFSIFSHMKKVILILSILALNAFAFNCIRTTFDIFVLSEYEMYDEGYEGLVPDSFYVDKGEGSYFSVKYYRSTNYLDSTMEYYIDPDTSDYRLTIYNTTAKIEKNGSSKTITLYTGGIPSQEIYAYLEGDSLYYKNYIFEDGAKTLDDYQSVYIENDTLHTADGNIIINDPENENKCSAQYYYSEVSSWGTWMTYEYETKGDTLIQTRDRGKILKTFYVPVKSQGTTSIKRKIRPAIDYKNAKHFDLLGRPVQGKYTVEFLK